MKLCLALTLLGSLDATLQVAYGALLACIALVLPFVWLGGKGIRPLRAVVGLLRAQPLRAAGSSRTAFRRTTRPTPPRTSTGTDSPTASSS